MKITRVSQISGIERTMELPVTQEQIDQWEAGGLIQHVMPRLTADQREFMISGATAEEWDFLFGGDDDDYDDIVIGDDEPAF